MSPPVGVLLCLFNPRCSSPSIQSLLHQLKRPDGTGTVKTKDGVSLIYNQKGPADGLDVLLIAGWCQTAAQWRRQYDSLAESFRMTTYDHRGHGQSEKINRGFRISRLAADLNDLIIHLDLRNVVILGHSMGCAVIWSHWDLFPDSRRRIGGFILVDQPPCMISPPTWTTDEGEQVGSVFDLREPDDIASALQNPDRKAFISNILTSMLTKDATREDVEWMTHLNLGVDPVNAGKLVLDHAKNDWRDVIQTINVPTLVIGATGSICPLAASEWTAANIVGARMYTMTEEEGGSHFMFWENAKKFNAVVQEFIESLLPKRQ